MKLSCTCYITDCRYHKRRFVAEPPCVLQQCNFNSHIRSFYSYLFCCDCYNDIIWFFVGVGGLWWRGWWRGKNRVIINFYASSSSFSLWKFLLGFSPKKLWLKKTSSEILLCFVLSITWQKPIYNLCCRILVLNFTW